MALRQCRECGHDVSGEATTCPNCGVKNPSPNHIANVLTKFFGIILTVAIVGFIVLMLLPSSSG
jgi:RNA polymerase subunit RPABC4/transcription elongation factor Spt4